jgi:signal transduction histidine kinase
MTETGPADARARLLDEYTELLRTYLAGGREAALERAYELARGAMAAGVGVHHVALLRLMQEKATAAEAGRLIQASGSFLVESLASFEMTHRAFQEANAALRRLNERLEEEARRIAHTLHAEAEQLLASVHMAVQAASQELPRPNQRRLAEVSVLLDQVSDRLRSISHELRPPILDDLGLIPALRALAGGVARRLAIPITISGDSIGRLPPATEFAVYRMVQEALNNIARHSKATRASIEISRHPGRLRCRVKDNGIGFEAETARHGARPRGLGFLGMRERLDAIGGTLELTTAPGQGVSLLATIPHGGPVDAAESAARGRSHRRDAGPAGNPGKK